MVRKFTKNVAESANKTIFICTHTLPGIEELYDRVTIINSGTLIVLGTVEEIITKTSKKNTRRRSYFNDWWTSRKRCLGLA
ncbi:MAG: hypothetical protein ACFFCQ_16305 [Promethearchaeota archaeon]